MRRPPGGGLGCFTPPGDALFGDVAVAIGDPARLRRWPSKRNPRPSLEIMFDFLEVTLDDL